MNWWSCKITNHEWDGENHAASYEAPHSELLCFPAALQVAVTTSNNGFGTPYIPYQVDARLSPNCKVQVNFVTV